MPSKHNKEPQEHKSKAELEQLAINQKEIARKRKLVTQDFYPALVKATVSVDEARALIHAMSSLLMEDVMRTMKDRYFKEIMGRMVDQLTQGGERKEEIMVLLQALAQENLFVAREIIEGTSRLIDQMVNDELKGRTLDTLNADWDRYLNS